ncbi:SGNH/GDSL hydrolase family protein [Niallia oryzisoli]|uniref:SGNH/GDSL hydrolase family protein n=1 Tax=Niallia oryzisoli TaxID=1737571 RepID=A0ABZ2CPY4_9BACI
MKFKYFSIILGFILILNTLAAPFVLAKNPDVPKSKLNIVAIGDSITFGYPPPSTTGFPDLISGARKVVKFGGSGATSSQLLEAINANPKEFKAAVKRADVITINIGSNDFMQATGIAALFAKLQPMVPNLEENLANGEIVKAISSTPLTPLTEQPLKQYSTNLLTIIETIKKHTKAPILLYNLYNPIVFSGNPIFDQFLEPLHNFIKENILVVNSTIQQVGVVTGIHVVDAYSAFAKNPEDFIYPFDIHPTPAGQQALASLADLKLQTIKNGKK